MDIEQHDHRHIISSLDLGHIPEHSPGMIVWHPAGMRVLDRIKARVLKLHQDLGYELVSSPILMHQSLWEKSGHWDKYRDHMFVVDQGDHAMAVKPMSCPGQIAIYQHRPKSYRDLPVKLFEFGHVHRNEASGALSGWLRLRGFVQDDSHVFASIDQIERVVADFVSMVESIYPQFGFSDWSWKLSLRPDQRAGSDDVWDRAEKALAGACEKAGISPSVHPGDGAFYGPKLEVVLKDRLGRSWQCGVIQLDFVLPERFDVRYHDHDGIEKHVVILHHAVLGSLERWLAIVMEHHGGLPDWMHPCPVVILPVSEKQSSAAEKYAQRLKQLGVACKIDDEGPVKGRMRKAEQSLVPWRAVIGAREAQEGVAMVRRGWGEMILQSPEELAQKI